MVAYGVAALVALVVVAWMLWPQRPPTLPRTLGTNLPVALVLGPEIPVAAATSAPPVLGVASNPVPRLTATNVALAAAPMPAAALRPVHNVFEAQILLARQGISCGSIDGVMGMQTRAALKAFQEREKLPLTGELDAVTRYRLRLDGSPVVDYAITAEDLAGLRPLSASWLGKSQQDRLGYETVLELVAERARAHPSLVRRLNPGFDWTNVVVGALVQLPNLGVPAPVRAASRVRIQLSARTLRVFDANSTLLAHFPCSIAARVEKRPVGELHVVVLAPNPNYTFNPEVFPESAEARSIGRKLVLPPGPNNPVGSAWIGLDRPGYGIHGTPRPEEVGRTESHGCFRLANWNAEQLVRMLQLGTPVLVEP
jgi:lipoprotein-anchoring transpeptidase ErfK/SrfK